MGCFRFIGFFFFRDFCVDVLIVVWGVFEFFVEVVVV